MSSFKRVWTDMHIYIYIYAYFSTPGIQKMGKLTKFGVDMFFLKLLESKTWGKLISFGVDMFFSNSWSPKKRENWLVLVLTCFFLKLLVLTCFSQTRASQKNGENWLVLVLTDWNLEPSAYTRIEGKIWKCTVAPKNNVFFQKGLNRHAYIYIYIYIFLNSWNPINGKID